MRVIFFLSKDIYVDLSICFPGYGQWYESFPTLEKIEEPQRDLKPK